MLYVVNNTFVNDDTASGAIFVDVASGGMLAAALDNFFVGSGTLSSTGALSADNLSATTPMFVNAAMYDYQLEMGSPAIGKAVAAGSAGTFSLTPVFEYAQPLGSVPRSTDKDLGAFEYGTSVMPASDGGIAATGDGGVGVADDAGINATADAGATSPDGGNSGGGGEAEWRRCSGSRRSAVIGRWLRMLDGRAPRDLGGLVSRHRDWPRGNRSSVARSVFVEAFSARAVEFAVGVREPRGIRTRKEAA
jgi:hypothetical protein